MPTTTQNNPMDVNTLINNLKLLKGNIKIRVTDPTTGDNYYIYSLTINKCDVSLDLLKMPIIEECNDN